MVFRHFTILSASHKIKICGAFSTCIFLNSDLKFPLFFKFSNQLPILIQVELRNVFESIDLLIESIDWKMMEREMIQLNE